MKKREMVAYLAMIAALVAIAIICILVKFCKEDSSVDVKNDLIISETGEKLPETSVETTEQEQPAEDNNRNEQEALNETKNEETVPSEYSQDSDASTGGQSVFDTSFADGYEFPDFSDYCFIFIGDSIFDMFNSHASMPRQLEVYTNASVYNLSKSGSCAGNESSGYISQQGLVESFINGTDTGDSNNASFNADIARFVGDNNKGKKMVIVLNHCINDYIFATEISNADNPYDLTTYEGALRTNINRLKNAYPKATIVYMEPYVIGANDYGNESNSKHHVMSEYVSALERVANECGIMRFDLRSYSTYAEYRDGYLLSDMIHPNLMCSKTIARLLCDFVQNNIG